MYWITGTLILIRKESIVSLRLITTLPHYLSHTIDVMAESNVNMSSLKDETQAEADDSAASESTGGNASEAEDETSSRDAADDEAEGKQQPENQGKDSFGMLVLAGGPEVDNPQLFE